MFDKQQLRWLLRALCDPPFLRLYIEADERGDGGAELTLADVEHAFWSLPADDEHAEKSRKESWKALTTLIATAGVSATPLRAADLFRRVHELLARSLGEATQDDSLERLPAFYGLDFLFAAPSPIAPAPPNFVETHAHFRGSVPIGMLWERLMLDIRLRAAHRGVTILAGTWERTRAELLARASEYPGSIPCALKCVNKDDSDLVDVTRAAAFLAIRADFGRHLTVQRGAVGLTSFTEAYDRYSGAAKRRKGRGPGRVKLACDDVDQVCAVLGEFHRRGIHGVELRPTAEDTRVELQSKLRPLILGYLRHLQEFDEPVALGLVLSLFKQTVASDAVKHRAHVDGSTAEPWVDAQRARWKRQVHSLLDVLEHVPALRLFIVGLDAAGREQGCPVRSLAPAFTLLRDRNRQLGVTHHTPGRRIRDRWMRYLRGLCRDNAFRGDRLQRSQQIWEYLNGAGVEGLGPPPPISPVRIGATMHAGEDFVDPISGLREIWEAIEFLELRSGDRLGHALAAALNPDLLGQLLERRGRSSFRSVEKLPGTRHYRITKPLGVHLLDEAWVFERLRERTPQSLTPTAGDVLQAASHTFAVPAEAIALSGHLGTSLPANALVPGLYFHEMEKLPPDLLTQVTIDEAYFRRFEDLRLRVLGQICARGLFVESCPTSNIVVAGLRTPPLQTFLQDIPLNVTVASDDPAIFNAWPDHEFHVHGRKHMERLVENSRRASFI